MAANATTPTNPITPPPQIDEYVDRLITTTVAKLVRTGSVQRCDREDWEQDLRLAVLQSIPGFNAARACWHTYANGVVHRSVQLRLRTRLAPCRDPRQCHSLDHLREQGEVPTAPDRHTEEEITAIDRVDAVRTALERMAPDERAVATALMQMGAQAARDHLGWPWRRFDAAKAGVERVLVRLGFGDDQTARDQLG